MRKHGQKNHKINRSLKNIIKTLQNKTKTQKHENIIKIKIIKS